MRISLIIFFMLLSSLSWAWRLNGLVLDVEGKAIPYASVFVQNTTYGVATNLKGEFFLELKSGTYTIVFQTVGYEKKYVPVTMGQNNQTLDVVLRESVTQLDEIKIEADKKDPAYAIIKKAIENRKKYRHPSDEFSCTAYIKASLQKEYFTHDTMSRKERDTLENVFTKERMNYIETYGTAHYRAPNSWKEIKTAVKDLSEKHNATVTVSISFDEDESYVTDFVNRQLFKTDLSEASFNFYRNNMDLPSLGPVPFVSPISNMAFLSYKFRLEETFMQDERWINKIEVIPRRKEAALFKGYIYIVDDWWNIKAVDLEPDRSELYNFKYFRILQDYDLVQDSAWMLSREEFFYNAKEGKMRIIGNTLIKYSDYNLNPEFPKRFFKNELSVITDEAFDKDSVFWDSIRPITLKDDEREFIRTQDSIAAYEKTEEFMLKDDSTYNRKDIWDILLNGFGWHNSFKKQTFYFNPLIQQAYIFGVGGYRHAPGGTYTKEFSRAYQMDIDWLLNYGFKNNDMKGKLGVDFLYAPKKLALLHTEYRNTYEMLNEYESIEAIFSRGNYVNDVFYSLGHEMEFINGLMVDITAEYGEKKPITGIELASWSDDVFGEFNEPQNFQAFSEFVFGIELRYTIGQKYMTAPYKKINLPSKWPTLILNYKKGVPGVFQGTADFDFLELQFRDEIKVGTMGVSKLRGVGGTYLSSKNVQITDYKFFRRSDMYLFSNPLKSFQLLRPGSSAISTIQPYLMLNYLHNFNGTIMNKIPLIKKLKLQAAVGTGVLLIEDADFRHSEVFAGLEWPFRIRRQMMKIGVYYAISDSNQSDLTGEIKIGFDFFNSWTNKWTY